MLRTASSRSTPSHTGTVPFVPGLATQACIAPGEPNEDYSFGVSSKTTFSGLPVLYAIVVLVCMCCVGMVCFCSIL